jgi:hypothetical protein
MASASSDTRILVWNLTTSSLEIQFKGSHKRREVNSLSRLEPVSSIPCAHIRFAYVRTWDATNGVLKFNFTGGNLESVFFDGTIRRQYLTSVRLVKLAGQSVGLGILKANHPVVIRAVVVFTLWRLKSSAYFFKVSFLATFSAKNLIVGKKTSRAYFKKPTTLANKMVYTSLNP